MNVLFFAIFCLFIQPSEAMVDVYSLNANGSSLYIPSSKIPQKNMFITCNRSVDEIIEGIKKPFIEAWHANDVASIIRINEGWSPDERDAQLGGEFFFPASMLDTSSFAAYHEENETVLLSILLSARYGHLEARMIAASIFDDPRFSSNVKDRLTIVRKIIRAEIERKSQEGNLEAIELLLDPILTLGNVDYIRRHLGCVVDYVTANSDHVNARTLLRLGNAHWKIGEYGHANSLYMKAALKGSKRAFVEMVNGFLSRKDLLPQQKKTEIESILHDFQNKLGGYEYLISAQHSQFGLDGIIERNLGDANRFYKRAAVDFDFPQACIDYGDFLISTTQAFSSDIEKIRRFYELAVNFYEKGGDLGRADGYVKAAQTLSHHKAAEGVVFEEDTSRNRAQIKSFYERILRVRIDSLLMEKIREQGLFEASELENLQQYQQMLKEFTNDVFEKTFSLRFDEIN